MAGKFEVATQRYRDAATPKDRAQTAQALKALADGFESVPSLATQTRSHRVRAVQ